MKHLKTFNENNSQKLIQINDTSEKRISILEIEYSNLVNQQVKNNFKIN